MITSRRERIKVNHSVENDDIVEIIPMSLGRQLLHGVYNGVDAGMTELLHGEYDKEFGVVDPVLRYSVMGHSGVVADKFDRAMYVSDVKRQQSAVLSPTPEPTPSPTPDPTPSSE